MRSCHFLLALAMLLVATSAQAQPTPQAAASVFLPMVVTTGQAPVPNVPLRSGEGTYYDATGGGACMFPASPGNLMVAAMNVVDYGTANMCGAFVAITGPRGSVTVRIVDLCPECKAGDIDMSPQAFDMIAERVKGRVPITWRVISPEISGPIRYHHKDGANQWWTAVQIRNHRNPVALVEYRAPSGQFVPMVRQAYNYWLVGSGGGLGTGPYTLRVTDTAGNTLIDTIPFQENSEFSGSGQFPKLP